MDCALGSHHYLVDAYRCSVTFDQRLSPQGYWSLWCSPKELHQADCNFRSAGILLEIVVIQPWQSDHRIVDVKEEFAAALRRECRSVGLGCRLRDRDWI